MTMEAGDASQRAGTCARPVSLIPVVGAGGGGPWGPWAALSSLGLLHELRGCGGNSLAQGVPWESSELVCAQ